MATEGQRYATAEARKNVRSTAPKSLGINASLPNAYDNDNDTTSRVPNLRELPVHRLMICLKANGFSNREIADKTGYSEGAVGHILLQPRARARMIAMQQEAGMDELAKTIRVGATQAVARIIARAEDPSIQALSPELAQRADEYLANRYLGKPKEQVEHSRKPVDQLSDSELLAIIQSGTDVEAVVGEIELKADGVGAA